LAQKPLLEWRVNHPVLEALEEGLASLLSFSFDRDFALFEIPATLVDNRVPVVFADTTTAFVSIKVLAATPEGNKLVPGHKLLRNSHNSKHPRRSSHSKVDAPKIAGEHLLE